MKKFLLFIFLSFISIYAFASNDKLDIEELFREKLDIKKEIPSDKLTVIYYILSHTYENNIHKMRGETDNVVYVNKDGREFVYNSITGELVQNDYNQGSYNYGKYEEPFDKFLLDILPWLKWGNTYNDPTDFTERLYYYLWDLNYGIQDYIFTGRKNELKKIEYKTLSREEKKVAHLFNLFLFNKKYKVTFSEDNYDKLESDGDYYFTYFYQILEFNGFKQ